MPRILDIASYLPEKVITNEELANKFENWTPEKIFEKTGIKLRHFADENENVSDMGFFAAKKLLEKTNFNKEKIDMLILVTQSQDQCLPSTSCMIHEKLELSSQCGNFDINQGCSGYIYGLSIAKSLIASGEFKNVLLITGDTYSKLINQNESSVATLFGDGATATLIVPDYPGKKGIGPSYFGTDSSKKDYLICNYLGLKKPTKNQKPLMMNGPGILNFTLSILPKELNIYLKQNNLLIEEFDLVLFHQANKFILKSLYKKIGIEDKGIISLENTGNTVSSSIPMVLETIIQDNKKNVLLAGFGVGLSWAFTSVVI
ncbi:3-oxoacyl-ACP synthase III family protein [uncultured Prochlorococcus sp.]|uniref:3-oxoacyl-ACP synthase III family protein n=1 Tax=uncultured Prochlorococcus sp. TaxID=159733 RepID=UPI0025826C32|nr:ketoacyl-ACP synthase III [uncultured Prochlorococcus sp.]